MATKTATGGNATPNATAKKKPATKAASTGGGKAQTKMAKKAPPGKGKK